MPRPARARGPPRHRNMRSPVAFKWPPAAVSRRAAVHLAAAAALAWAALTGASGCRREREAPYVTINSHRWFVDLAMTPAQRYRGLSGRGELRNDTGMLFIYPRAKVRDFCMRGCRFPLDIAFLDADRRVVQTHTMRVEPGLTGEVRYSSVVPAQYVLEVSAGALRSAGATPGTVVHFSRGVPPPAKAEPGP